MRNLKKTLCLVLALVFVLGLCTVGAADLTYTDAADITAEYEGAIKAMSGLGILKGYGDGSFKPDQEVTRGEAAKIIAYICLGAENADKYPARDVFSDVKATDWYAPYVGYCVNNGIINGKGNGTFAPKDPVKQVELAKMLLAACGYGAKDEFVGKDWDFNVVERAIKTGIAKKLLGADLNWDAAATREITSVLAYATMMKVNQVEVSKDTNAYVDLAGANGVDVGTFAEATWGLYTVTGIVRFNKANSAVAGTQLIGMNKTVWFSDSTTTDLFTTDDDEDAGLLGHRVSIQFREEETSDGKLYMKAYFVEDLSTEKAPAEVVGKTGATVYDCFDGVLGGGGTTAPANALALTLAPYAGGTFVLDADGTLLTYKENDFVVETLTVTKGKGTTATYTTGITNIPADAKTGDIVCVYKCGIYTTAKAAPSAEVLISQSQGGTYNNGAIHATAANGANNLISSTAFTTYAGALDVGKTYTLWYDCEGGVVAFKEKAGPAAAAKDYYLLMNGRQAATDPYATGTMTNYAQLMKPDGTIVEQIVENDMSVAPAKTVVSLADTDADGLLELIAVGAGDPVANGVAYAPSAVIVFDNASFVAYTGTGSGLKVASTTDKPDTGKNVYYIYETVGAAVSGDSTVAIQKVKSVWFDIADKHDASATEVKGSYIYVSGTASNETKLVGSAVKYFFPGYKDGVLMDDLYFKAADPQTIGFYTYKDATAASGNRYALTPVAALVGTGTGVVSTTLKSTANVNTDSFITGGKLYMNGAADKGIDLSAVKVVILPTAGAPTTMEASVNGILATVATKNVTITFVETLTATSAACTSGVIYVTAVA